MVSEKTLVERIRTARKHRLQQFGEDVENPRAMLGSCHENACFLADFLQDEYGMRTDLVMGGFTLDREPGRIPETARKAKANGLVHFWVHHDGTYLEMASEPDADYFARDEPPDHYREYHKLPPQLTPDDLLPSQMEDLVDGPELPVHRPYGSTVSYPLGAVKPAVRNVRSNHRHDPGHGACSLVSNWIHGEYGWPAVDGLLNGEGGHCFNVLPDGSIFDGTSDQFFGSDEQFLVRPDDERYDSYQPDCFLGETEPADLLESNYFDIAPSDNRVIRQAMEDEWTLPSSRESSSLSF